LWQAHEVKIKVKVDIYLLLWGVGGINLYSTNPLFLHKQSNFFKPSIRCLPASERTNDVININRTTLTLTTYSFNSTAADSTSFHTQTSNITLFLIHPTTTAAAAASSQFSHKCTNTHSHTHFHSAQFACINISFSSTTTL
jgi:hypothetical protein